MTSLIFGAVYLAHQGVVHARHEKKRLKNYERWEGLRDEYDEQRKISRESRSLDIQRTGQTWEDNDRPILTLRDQQEAGDARTSWRPQESWNDPAELQNATPTGRQSMDASASPFAYDHRASINGIHNRNASQPNLGRSVSLNNGNGANSNAQQSLKPQPTGYHGIGPMRATPTGANWDDGLPRPLTVQRRTNDEIPSSTGNGAALGRSTSLRTTGSYNRSRSNLGSANSSTNNLVLSNSTTHTSPPLPSATLSKDAADNMNNPFAQGNRFDTQPSPPANSSGVQPTYSNTNNPFERDAYNSQQSTPSIQQQPFAPQHQMQTPPMRQQSFSQQPLQPQQTSNNPFDSNNRWDNQQPSYSNGASAAFAQQVPGGRMATLVEGPTPAGEKDMSEWWK